MVTGRKSKVRNYKEKRGISYLGRIILPLCVILAVCLLYFSVRLFFYSPDESLDDYGKKDYIEAEQNAISHKNDKEFSAEENFDENTAETYDTEQIEEDLPPMEEQVPQEPKPKAKKIKKIEKQAVVKTAEKNVTKKEADKTVSAKKSERKVKDTKATKIVENKKEAPKSNQVNNNAAKAEKNKTQNTAADNNKIKPTNEKNTAKKPDDNAKANVTSRWDVQIGGFADKERAQNLIKDAGKSGFAAYMTEAEKDGKPFYKVRVKGEEDREKANVLKSHVEAAGFPVYLVQVKN